MNRSNKTVRTSAVLLLMSVLSGPALFAQPTSISSYPPAGIQRENLTTTPAGFQWRENFQFSKRFPALASAAHRLETGQGGLYQICVVGDSISEGAAASEDPAQFLEKGYVGQLRKALAARYGDTGRGFIPSYYANQWRFNGYTYPYSAYGVGGWSHVLYHQGASAQIEFEGTGFSLVTHASPKRGRFSSEIGPIKREHTNYQKEAGQIRVVEIAKDLPPGRHRLLLTNREEREFHIIGGYEQKAKSGFQVNTTSKSETWTTLLTQSEGTMTAQIDLYKPVLTIIASITNDITSGMPKERYQDNLEKLILRAKKSGDVLLLANNLRTDRSLQEQQPYVEAMRRAAAKHQCQMLDLFAKANGQAAALGYMADSLHPNAKGHEWMAQELLDFLQAP